MPCRVLYWLSGSAPAWRATAVLAEKKLEYESKMLDASKGALPNARNGSICLNREICPGCILPNWWLWARHSGEHKSDEVLALNPRGQVPTFKDGDIIINESMAILQYIEETYPEPPLLPSDKADRAQAYQRFHETTLFYSAIRPLFLAKIDDKVNTDNEKVSLWAIRSMRATDASDSFALALNNSQLCTRAGCHTIHHNHCPISLCFHTCRLQIPTINLGRLHGIAMQCQMTAVHVKTPHACRAHLHPASQPCKAA